MNRETTRTAQMVDLADLDLEDFMLVAVDRGLATQAELDQFAAGWREGYANGEKGFGIETTIEDWVGGLKAWRLLWDLLEKNGYRRYAQIDWSRLRLILTGSLRN